MGFNLVSGCLVGKSIRAARAVFVELRLPIGKPPRVNCIAHFLHNHLIKMQIVYGVELCAQNLAHFVQVIQIGAAKMGAGVAGAAFV